MKASMIVGILLIVLGIVALGYEGITYTTREKVVDIGPLKASVEKKKTIPLSPVLGGAALIGGVVLVLAGSRGGWARRRRARAAVQDVGEDIHQGEGLDGLLDVDVVPRGEDPHRVLVAGIGGERHRGKRHADAAGPLQAAGPGA